MPFGPKFFMFYTYFIIKFEIIFSKFKIGHSKKLQLKNAIKSNYWGGVGKIFNLEKLEIQSRQDLRKSSQLKPWDSPYVVYFIFRDCSYIVPQTLRGQLAHQDLKEMSKPQPKLSATVGFYVTMTLDHHHHRH